MKKFITTTLLAGSLSLTAFAQFNVGGGIAINKYGGDYKKTHPALQIRAGYDFNEGKYFLNGGLNYSPIKGKTDFPYYATNGTDQKDVTVTQSVSINNVFIRAGRSFGAPENTFHFKLFAGGSFDMLSIKYSADVPAGYTMEPIEDQKATGPKMDLGIGGDYTIGSGRIFAELMIGLPANKVNDQEFENPTVGHTGFVIGYKFYFGGNRYY